MMDFSLFGLQGLHQVFNVHPVFVHFPIALFPREVARHSFEIWQVMELHKRLGGRLVYEFGVGGAYGKHAAGIEVTGHEHHH
jgi:uncharacterized membrane protein